MREFELGAEIALSEAGALIGHVALGQQMVAERAARLDGFPDAASCTRSRTACWPTTAPTPCRAGASARAEALALHRLNALDAAVKGALEHGLPDLSSAALVDACPTTLGAGRATPVGWPIETKEVCPSTHRIRARLRAGSVDELLRQLVGSRFVLTDREAAVTRWSGPAQALFGWDPHAMLGRPLLQTLGSTRSRPHERRPDRDVRAAQDGHELEVELTSSRCG